jgi:cytochrome oxidase assembly protein ShyY1
MILLASATTEWITAAGTVAAALFALIATGVALWQLPRISKQLTLAAETNVSQAYSVVSERMSSLRNLLAEDDAALYPYF